MTDQNYSFAVIVGAKCTLGEETETSLFRAGSLRGIIIPANITKLLGLEESVQMELDNEKLILTPVKKKKPREGWEEAIRAEIEKNGQPERILPRLQEYLID